MARSKANTDLRVANRPQKRKIERDFEEDLAYLNWIREIPKPKPVKQPRKKTTNPGAVAMAFMTTLGLVVLICAAMSALKSSVDEQHAAVKRRTMAQCTLGNQQRMRIRSQIAAVAQAHYEAAADARGPRRKQLLRQAQSLRRERAAAIQLLDCRRYAR